MGMKIIVDAFGGDYSPEQTVLGALDALGAKSSLRIVLTGDEEKITEVLKGQSYDKTRLEIVHAPAVVTGNDVPTEAVRKRDSSILLREITNAGIKTKEVAFRRPCHPFLRSNQPNTSESPLPLPSMHAYSYLSSPQ